MAKIEIEIDDSVMAELEYIMAFAANDSAIFYKDVGSALTYLASAWADAGRRPGAWERDCFNQLGLIPNCKEFNYYRQSYGDPNIVDIETIQLTQEDIDNQNQNYDADYLSKAEIGDWVYDDGEVLCSQSCVDHWYQTSSTEKERKNWLRIFEHLKSLNKKII